VLCRVCRPWSGCSQLESCSADDMRVCPPDRGWKVESETIGNKHISVSSEHASERSAPLRGQAPAQPLASASQRTTLAIICVTELKTFFRMNPRNFRRSQIQFYLTACDIFWQFILTIYFLGSTALLLGLGLSSSFLILYTVGRTPWTGISPSQGRYLHTEHRH
jgi:hypothetical protein